MTFDAPMIAWLNFADRLHNFSVELLASSNIVITEKGSSDPKVVAATLLIRAVGNFKGTLCVAREGLIVEARTLARSCLENLFWIAGVQAEGDAFVHDMGRDELVSTTWLTEMVIGYASIDEARKKAFTDHLSKLTDRLSKPKRLRPESVAKKSLISDSYVIYKMLSADAAHPSVRALNRFIVCGADGFRGINMEAAQSRGEMALTVHYACIALIGCCVAFNEMMGFLPPGEGLGGLVGEFDALKTSTEIG
ncbi:hypothetical protein HB662_22045 [Roseomonas frigidaquae]|uniref:Uncharacterized protein n=1 Tax=Falsiroseomonas frigidaquae TaxID=487318 RepID=A0ABX1F5F9_9PROT|nr:DUF5677 domain-containing protein [Falsiroseomonas frigidaquae]NKE47476.1 hypothetical protein [Falsiroseomonas frigidaquae]